MWEPVKLFMQFILLNKKNEIEMAESPKNAAAAATEAATQENTEETKKHDVEYADEEGKNAVSTSYDLPPQLKFP